MVSDQKMSCHPNWRALATVAFPYKRFIHETRPNDETGSRSSTFNVSEDCRAVYEEVLAEPISNVRKPDNSESNFPKIPDIPKKAPTQHLDRNQWVNALMKEASVNNVQDLGLSEDPKKSSKYLSEVEKLGEEILVDRQEIVALDKRRNHNREALRALKNATSDKTWMAVGSLLIKMPCEQASKASEKDQMHLDVEINKSRSNSKVKVNALQDMEHKDPIPGLMLQPMTHKEMKTIKSAMGISS